MLVKPPLQDQKIIDCLNTHYSINTKTLEFLPIGADINSWLYKVEATNQSTYFVKLKQGHNHDVGIEIVELLHAVGIQQVIPPIKALHRESNQFVDDYTLIVYPYINGQDGFKQVLTDDEWQTLGKALRQVHEIEVPSTIRHMIRREKYSPTFREMVRSLYPYIENNIFNDEISQKLQTYMKENLLTIKKLVDRAESLAATIIQNQSPKFVLCHSDIHGGNVLIGESESIYIVDWDNPIMAPKERDLMFIGGGVANVWNKQHEIKEFYKGYGKTEINKTILAYYRHERIVEDIALYGQDILLKVEGGENRVEMLKHFIAMFEPEGVIDIAFKTGQE